MKPTLKPPGIKRLKLMLGHPLSNFAFEFNLRCYTMARTYMSVEEVVAVAEAGRCAGATECLFTLGDRPEARYPAAAAELQAMVRRSRLTLSNPR
jgi:hypothetical protein